MKVMYGAILSITLGVGCPLISQIGCLEKGWHLKRPFDNKTYNYVGSSFGQEILPCTCPCDNYKAQGLYAPERNQCLQCLHYHKGRPLIIIQELIQEGKSPVFAHLLESPQSTLHRLIEVWKEQKHPSLTKEDA